MMKAKYRVALIALVIVVAIPVFIKIANRANKAYAAYDASLVRDRGLATELMNDQWLNTAKPMRLADLRGQVVVLDFWRFECSECITSLPYMRSAYSRYQGQGVQFVSIHTPETGDESNINNVQAFIKQAGIAYPVA